MEKGIVNFETGKTIKNSKDEHFWCFSVELYQ